MLPASKLEAEKLRASQAPATTAVVLRARQRIDGYELGDEGARLARREEEEYSTYCNDEQQSQPGRIGVQIAADIR